MREPDEVGESIHVSLEGIVFAAHFQPPSGYGDGNNDSGIKYGENLFH